MSDVVVKDLGGLPLITPPKKASPTERAALLQGAVLYDELVGGVDARTLDLLVRRRANRVVTPRRDLHDPIMPFPAAQWEFGGEPVRSRRAPATGAARRWSCRR